MGIKLQHYIKTENKIQFNDSIKTFFFMSILFIASLTMFPIEFSTKGLFEINLIPFKTIFIFISSGNLIDILANIFGNTILFAPLGFFSYFVYKGNKYKSLKLCLLGTILVETTQLIIPARLSDIDDIILNFLGGYIGVIIAIKFTQYINSKQKSS